MTIYDVELAVINEDGIIEMWDADAIPNFVEAESAEEAIEFAKDYLWHCMIDNGVDPSEELIELRAREVGVDYLPIAGQDGWVYSDDNNALCNNPASKEEVPFFINWAYNWYKLNWGVKRNLLPEDVHDETSVNGESPLSVGDFVANVLSDEAVKKEYEELYVLLSILSWIDSEYTHREFLEFCEKELSMTSDEMNTYTDSNPMSLAAMNNVLCADSDKQISRVREMLKTTLNWLIEAADLHYNNFYKVFVVDMGLPQKIIQDYVDIPELQSRSEYSARLASLENRCEEIGAEAPSFWFFDHEHLNPIWYLPDVVASVCYKGCLIEVYVRGITEASLNGGRISNDGNKALIQDRNVLNALKNDAVIDGLLDSKELVFFARPWVEASIFNSNGVCIKTSIPDENCDVLSALERYFNCAVRCIDNYTQHLYNTRRK